MVVNSGWYRSWWLGILVALFLSIVFSFEFVLGKFETAILRIVAIIRCYVIFIGFPAINAVFTGVSV